MHCKQINHAIIIALILALSAGTSLAKPVTVKLRVKGMTCGGCATAVANALKSTEGVDEARISYKRGTAIVKYDDQKITVLKLREVINNIGFVCELPKSATNQIRTDCRRFVHFTWRYVAAFYHKPPTDSRKMNELYELPQQALLEYPNRTAFTRDY